MSMNTDGKGIIIQAFPLVSGKINKTTGTFANCFALQCVEDGTIAVHGETVQMVAGDVNTVGGTTVVINSGKFHLA